MASEVGHAQRHRRGSSRQGALGRRPPLPCAHLNLGHERNEQDEVAEHCGRAVVCVPWCGVRTYQQSLSPAKFDNSLNIHPTRLETLWQGLPKMKKKLARPSKNKKNVRPGSFLEGLAKGFPNAFGMLSDLSNLAGLEGYHTGQRVESAPRVISMRARRSLS